MKRLAAHYVLLPDDRLLKQHYVELDDENRLLGVFPLEKEMANTVFIMGSYTSPQPPPKEGEAQRKRGMQHFGKKETPHASPSLGGGRGEVSIS